MNKLKSIIALTIILAAGLASCTDNEEILPKEKRNEQVCCISQDPPEGNDPPGN